MKRGDIYGMDDLPRFVDDCGRKLQSHELDPITLMQYRDRKKELEGDLKQAEKLLDLAQKLVFTAQWKLGDLECQWDAEKHLPKAQRSKWHIYTSRSG
jgi:hypothetical protein